MIEPHRTDVWEFFSARFSQKELKELSQIHETYGQKLQIEMNKTQKQKEKEL